MQLKVRKSNQSGNLIAGTAGGAQGKVQLLNTLGLYRKNVVCIEPKQYRGLMCKAECRTDLRTPEVKSHI